MKYILALDQGTTSSRAILFDQAGGPVAVVYPDAVWYSYVDHEDIEEIVASHLKQGQVVDRLLLPPTVGK